MQPAPPSWSEVEKETEEMTRKIVHCCLFLAVASLAFAGTAAARGPHKDRACLLECRQDLRACHAPARADFRLCRGGCSELAAAAHQACADDSSTEPCASAREALKACVAPCREDAAAAVGECHADARDCSDSCPDNEPVGPKDLQCLAGCRDAQQQCRDDAYGVAVDCGSPCADLAAKARATCDVDRRSEACRTARADAHDCLQPCRGALGAAHVECVRLAQSCAASCPDRENTGDVPVPQRPPRRPFGRPHR